MGRWKAVYWLLFLGLFIWGLYRLINQTLLPINTLYITGNVTHISEAQITEVVGKNVLYGFFAVDLSVVKTALEGMQWVQAVSVRRVWPDALHIDIQEHSPVARWGEAQLINQRGDLFVPDHWEGADTLPLLIGPPGLHQYLYGQYVELQNLLNDTGLQVTKLVYDMRRAMHVSMQNGMTLQLGRLNNVTDNHAELRLFAKAYQSNLKDREADIAGIDLRYTNGFAVLWKEQPVLGAMQNNNNIDLRT